MLIDHNGHEILCRLQDVRHFLALASMVQPDGLYNAGQSLSLIQKHVEALQTGGSIQLFGTLKATRLGKLRR